MSSNVLLAATLWVSLGAEFAFPILGGTGEKARFWMGINATVVLLAFFASPLSSLFEVRVVF